ncbi:MAG: DUF3574 domain-containing protein [Verrucomicrobiae bacterium]|nr:DUF3574 domain-containing protein [Verrucomicrobiae bacterium]
MNLSSAINGRAPRPDHITLPAQSGEIHPVSLHDVDSGWTPPTKQTVAEPDPHIRHEIYFGLGRKNSPPVSESVWEAFASANLPACFPAGYTVLDATGGSPATAGHEPSKVVIILVPACQRGVGITIAALALCWKRLAAQHSVLWVSAAATAVNL